RPAQVRAALSSGIDSYRRADYEMAAAYFQQAQAGQNDLSAQEQGELTRMGGLNNSALQARRNGGGQLQQAEAARQAGPLQNAPTYLQAVTTNVFLTPTDKTRAQKLGQELAEKMRGGASSKAVTVAAKPSNGVQARAKLQQARMLMAKANYAAAEALA